MVSPCAVLVGGTVLATTLTLQTGATAHLMHDLSAEHTTVVQHATHHAQHLHAKQPPVSLKSIETMATFSSVLDTAESLQKLSVQNIYNCMLTAYGPGFESTGKHPGDPGYGITASGLIAKPLHTIAVDPKLIPLGSLVYIDGIGYRVAEDVGGAIQGHHIDVYFPSDDQARVFGIRNHVRVTVFNGRDTRRKLRR